jgi:hypothetical protein
MALLSLWVKATLDVATAFRLLRYGFEAPAGTLLLLASKAKSLPGSSILERAPGCEL